MGVSDWISIGSLVIAVVALIKSFITDYRLNLMARKANIYAETSKINAYNTAMTIKNDGPGVARNIHFKFPAKTSDECDIHTILPQGFSSISVLGPNCSFDVALQTNSDDDLTTIIFYWDDDFKKRREGRQTIRL